MADLNDRAVQASSRTEAVAFDAGLRAYMLRVYNYMALGLALTGITAYLTYATPALSQLFFAADATGMLRPTGLGWVATFAPLGIVLALSFGVQKLSANAAQALFWVFATVMGISLSTIFITYTGADVARVFFITAASFGALSLYGYTTQRDLSGLGSFMFIGLIGIILASIVNIFLKSSGLEFAVSVIGVLVFAGLTAYDTQRIKEMYSANYDGTVQTKTAVMGALSLYLDFINMFLMLLRLFGSSRS